jgi:hypothetical protein
LALPRKKAYLIMKLAQFNRLSWVFQLVEFELNLERFEKELDMMNNNIIFSKSMERKWLRGFLNSQNVTTVFKYF